MIHTINVQEIQEFLSTAKILCASSSREKKKLVFTGTGNFEVKVNGVAIWTGINLAIAVEIYNSIGDTE